MASFVQLFGDFLKLMAILIFVYFSTWLFGSQYIPENSPIHLLFPPMWVAIYGPLVLLVCFVIFVAQFILRAMSKMKKK